MVNTHQAKTLQADDAEPSVTPIPKSEAWVFGGQATLDAQLFCERIRAYADSSSAAQKELNKCREITATLLGGDADRLFSGSEQQCKSAAKSTPAFGQVAIHLQNVLGANLWRAQGHAPKILLGHSFGEIAAFGVGGCFDLATGVRIVCTRMQAVDELAPANAGLLIVSCDRNTVAIEADLLGLDQVVFAGRNHNSQLVMSGPTEQLSRLKGHLQSMQIGATSIDSPTSFHHPQLRAVASKWLKELRCLQLRAPSLAVYSPISQRLINATDDIPELLASQLTLPFDLQSAITELRRVGVTSFVDCGSSGVLARLISKAGGENVDVQCVGSQRLTSQSQTTPTAAELAHATTSDIPEIGRYPDKAPIDSATPKAAVSQIAIVGQGCILPGGVSSPEDLFSAITEQRIGIVDQREFDSFWSDDFYSAELTPDRSNSHLFGRIRDGDISVPNGVDPDTFHRFTRTQKLLCIALAPCIASLQGAERVTCLLGSTADGFEDQDEVASLLHAGIDPCDPEVDRKMHTARSAFHSPHSAVQEVLDRIVGPGLKVTLVDAACASSLYSLALGMQALESNQADAVIAGGFFCPGPGNSCLFSQFRGTTSTGCRPFDAHADGVVFSEGAALVTLRRVEDAERFELPVSAVIAGAGLSSDGRSPSANVPQSKGQLLSLERCYANYGIDPASIVAIEAHGTSTPVGDATELVTLRSFFAAKQADPIPIHSLKGLLGHAGWAAGTASVIAVCEYLRNGLFPSQATFRQPSNALLDSSGTLTVSTKPIALPPRKARIAIDGFGFGGANAHVVLERYDAHRSKSKPVKPSFPEIVGDEGELVFVAYHAERPRGSARFERDQVKPPKKFIILPQLADDMDISQNLAVIVSEQVLQQVPQFDEAMRRETSLLLAMSGKTERAVEATFRIMTERMRRVLQGNEHLLDRLDAAHSKARPSGAYTLQCMMPNVAAGRAALLLNLNGPNFVVDAGADSLEAAFTAAALLLGSGDKAGTKMVIVAAIDTQTSHLVDNAIDHVDPIDHHGCEFAAAYAVTTRGYAQACGLRVICGVDEVFRPNEVALASSRVVMRPYEQFQALQDALDKKSNTTSLTSAKDEVAKPPMTAGPSRPQRSMTSGLSSASPRSAADGGDCEIQVPVWVEKPVAGPPSGTQPAKHMLIVVKAGFARLAELRSALPEIAEQSTIALVGDSTLNIVSASGQSKQIAIDRLDEQSLASAVEKLCHSAVDVITVMDEAISWDLQETLAEVARDNRLCELLFLIAKQEIARLKSGGVEMWGVLLGAWNGQTHPCSGPIAGLLKSISREFPATRNGTICTQGLDLATALRRLNAERLQADREPELVFGPEFRLVRRLRPAPVDLAAPPQVKLNANSIVVAVGGAKGVTAVMLDSLLCDAQCTAIAIGRSPLEAGPENFDSAEVEQAYYARFMRENAKRSAIEMRKNFDASRGRWEAYQTIQQLASRGGRVEYMVADVTDTEQLATTVENIVSRFGKIDLLLYGAGVQKSKRLEDRSLADFREVFSTKVLGLQNFVGAYYSQTGQRLASHILTSAYSIFGNDGQHDYGAANETLDRLCSLTEAGGGTGWTSMAWLAWDGIGMTRGTEYQALAKKRRLSGVIPELGQRLFREVCSGHTRSAIHVPISEAEHVEYGVRTIPYSPSMTSGRAIEVNIRLSNIPCLPNHKVRNVPTLPGAWILDLLVGAGRKLAPIAAEDSIVIVEDLTFSKFVRLSNNQESNVRVVAQECGNSVAVWMISDVLHPSGVTLARDRICASAILSWEIGQVSSTPIEFGVQANSTRGQAVRDPYCDPSKPVVLSGPFDCLSDIELSVNGRSAKVKSSPVQTFHENIPALLLDAAWRVGAMYTPSRASEVFVPIRIGRMSLPLRSSPFSTSSSVWEIRSTTPRSENRDVRWDRTDVFDQNGRLQLVIENALATCIA
ncbi:MAG: SDR family oxidoreductase [Pirellulaceae bacterium]